MATLAYELDVPQPEVGDYSGMVGTLARLSRAKDESKHLQEAFKRLHYLTLKDRLPIKGSRDLIADLVEHIMKTFALTMARAAADSRHFGKVQSKGVSFEKNRIVYIYRLVGQGLLALAK